MNAVRTFAQINEAGNIEIKGLPFKKGELVEVLVFQAQNDDLKLVDEWESLFKSIQELEVSNSITEDIINKEIKEYRNSK